MRFPKQHREIDCAEMFIAWEATFSDLYMEISTRWLLKTSTILGALKMLRLVMSQLRVFRFSAPPAGGRGCLPRPERIVERCGAVVFRFFMH